MFGHQSVAVAAGAVTVRPGLGRHQLGVAIRMRPTHAAAYDHDISMGGSLAAVGLSRGGGYLGTAHWTEPRTLRRDGLIEETLLTDIEPAQLAAIEARREGPFKLHLTLLFRSAQPDGLTERAAAMIADHPVSREEWLAILSTVDYQQTLLLELALPDPQTVPTLATSLQYLQEAQRRALEGQHRQTVESLRQALASLVGKKADEEDDAEAVTTAIKSARRSVANSKVDYDDRFEVVRQALKFLADLGAHPETAETTLAEARSALIMVSGLLQWYAGTSGQQRA